MTIIINKKFQSLLLWSMKWEKHLWANAWWVVLLTFLTFFWNTLILSWWSVLLAWFSISIRQRKIWAAPCFIKIYQIWDLWSVFHFLIMIVIITRQIRWSSCDRRDHHDDHRHQHHHRKKYWPPPFSFNPVCLILITSPLSRVQMSGLTFGRMKYIGWTGLDTAKVHALDLSAFIFWFSRKYRYRYRYR